MPTALLTKELQTKAEQKLSTKEVSKLQSDVQESLHQANGAATALLPKKDVTLRRCPSGSAQTRLYLRQGTAVLFEPAGSTGPPLPTLVALWHHEISLPALVVPQPVSEFVLSGADLMLPGIIAADERLLTLHEGECACVCVAGNPAPFAVGRLLLPGAAIAAQIGKGAKGRALETMHAFGDALWRLCRSKPNTGFVIGEDSKSVVPIEESSTLSESSALPASPPLASSEVAAIDAEGTGGSTSGAAAGVPTEPPSVSRENADALMRLCFLQACHRISDKQLPMALNALYAGHMRPLRPVGSSLDVKASSWKKLLPFMRQMASDGLCKLTTPKQPNAEPSLSRIERGADAYQAHQPCAHTAEAAEGCGGSGSPPRVSVLRLYRPCEAQRPLFVAAGLGEDRKAFFEEAEVMRVLDGWISSHESLRTGAGGQKLVTLDPLLYDALFKGDRDAEVVDTIQQYQLKRRWMERLEAWTKISGGVLEKPLLARQPPAVQIVTATRRGHKVTLVSGLRALGLDENIFAEEVKAIAGAGCGIEETVGEKSQLVRRDVVVQGYWDRSVAEHLLKAYRLPEQCVDNTALKKKAGERQKKA